MAIDFMRNPFSVTPAQTPVQTPAQMPTTPGASEKNQRLGLMLYALGGALRGDKNFVQNTLQLQQMQEGKKKQKKQEQLWEDWKKNNPDVSASLKSFGDMLTFEQRANLIGRTLEPAKEPTKAEIEAKILGKIARNEPLTEAEQRTLDAIQRRFPKDVTPSDYLAKILGKIAKGEKLTAEDQRVLDVIQRTDPVGVAIRENLRNMPGTPIQTPTDTQEKEIKTYASKQDAINAGLKSGDQFYGTDGNLYQIP